MALLSFSTNLPIEHFSWPSAKYDVTALARLEKQINETSDPIWPDPHLEPFGPKIINQNNADPENVKWPPQKVVLAHCARQSAISIIISEFVLFAARRSTALKPGPLPLFDNTP
jgi:hypothetical protein